MVIGNQHFAPMEGPKMRGSLRLWILDYVINSWWLVLHLLGLVGFNLNLDLSRVQVLVRTNSGSL